MKEFIEIPETPKVEPAGMITIEVTDAETGELVTQDKKSNFVQERLLRALSKMNAHMPFKIETYYAPALPINGVELTDYAGAPQPDKENFVQGNMVGFGIKDLASSGNKRGAWNAAESVIRTDYIKLVFDFPTSQANGTFQSIYTRLLNGDYPDFFDNSTLVVMNFPFTWQSVRKAGDALYFWNPNTTFLYKVSPFVLKLRTGSTPFNEIEYETFTFPVALSGYGHAIRGNEIFRIQSNKVQKATINPVSNFVDVFTPGFTCANIAYHEPSGRFYIEKNVAGDYVIYIYDASFTLIEVSAAGKEIGSFIGVTDDGKHFKKGYNLVEIATGRSMLHTTSSNSYYHIYEGVEIGDYYLGGNYYGRGRLGAAPTFFSRVLLDSPVTKTAQQNMKITYEFMIPPLQVFGPPAP